MKKEVWFDGRNVKITDNKVIPIMANTSIEKIVVQAKNRQEYKLPKKTKYITFVETEEELALVQEGDVVLSDSVGILEEAKKKGFQTGIYIPVNDRTALEYAADTAGNYNYAVIRFACETNIPLELLIAKLQSTGTALLKEVTTARDGKIAFDVMEYGADGVLLASEDMKEIIAMDSILQSMEHSKLAIVPARVKAVEHIGMGYRGCIDTTSLLKKNEGMLVGSFSNGGLLVSSETHYLPYMNLRPFRVNAGAVHSYVWAGSGNTEYLTDLKSGSKVLAVDHEGNAREVSVGRMKIEARPLLKIVAEAEGQIISTIVQDDWHIRLLGINGEPYNASILTADTVLAGYLCEPGRHVGIKIEEDILER